MKGGTNRGIWFLVALYTALYIVPLLMAFELTTSRGMPQNMRQFFPKHADLCATEGKIRKENPVDSRSIRRFCALGTTLACAGLALLAALISSPRGRAYAQASDESDSRIQKGFEIALRANIV